MGIKNLSKLIKKFSPDSIKKRSLLYYRETVLAIDAPMALYQLLIAIRTADGQLRNDLETTSHLNGLFFRCINFIVKKIRVIFVFDGKKVEEKEQEILRREEIRKKARKQEIEAAERGDTKEVEKFQKRQVRITETIIKEAKTLFDLLGIPYVESETEAEAYCAYLNRVGKVHAVMTEDFDTLAFHCKKMIRVKREEVTEYDTDKILNDFNMNRDEFIDLCILLGCDFSGTLKNIGPKRSYDLITKYRSIEKILENETVEGNLNYEAARILFKEMPTGPVDIPIRYGEIKKEELLNFMENKGFNRDRILKSVEKAEAIKKAKVQSTLHRFIKKK